MLFITITIPLVSSLNDNTLPKLEPNIIQSSSQQNWTQLQKLLHPDGAYYLFGFDVSLSGDTALVGSPYDGSAYVFTRNGTNWTLQQQFLVGGWFGVAVSIDGDTALIGDQTGSAYVFTRNGTVWTQQAILLASDGEGGDYFGQSVCLNGDTALVGAYNDDDNGIDSGSAYVFTRTGTNWTQQAKLLASDGAAGDTFGNRVSIDGNTAFIGAPTDDDNGENSGSVYVFTRTGTTWTQKQKLFSTDGAAGDLFGFSVSLDGNTALIGAFYNYNNGNMTGSTYVFTRAGTTWTQSQKLIASDGEYADNFGISVSLSGNTALIGAHGEDDNGQDSGSAYIFIRISTTWTEQAKVLASDGLAGEWFGYAVSVSGHTALIGSPISGSAYLFQASNQPPNPPTITGPIKAKIKVATAYNFTTTDPNGDDFYYFVDWGDGTNSSWIGPYSSGDLINESHTWSKEGTYTIKAKAKDVYGNESDWGTLSVTMPTSYNIPFEPFWERLFERFPSAFPILRHLMGY